MSRSGLTLECHPQTLSTLIFHLKVFLLLTQRGGQCEMIGSPKPIIAMIGEDVILPCHLDRCTNVFSMTLEWARLDLNPRFVHVRLEGEEILLDQNPAFVGRASSSPEKIQHGDLSLKLSKVRISDEGTYRCQMPGMGSSEVLLFVGAVSPPVVLMGGISNSGLDLHCESSGWYPEPEVLWLDEEGKLLSAEPAETVKGRDDLYSVSSRMSLERRNNINITCRVQQNKINQTRETNVQILDVCSALSICATCIAVVIAAVLLMLSAVFFVLWKMKQRKGMKNLSDEEKKEEERVPFQEVLTQEEDEKSSTETMKKEEGETLVTETMKEEEGETLVTETMKEEEGERLLRELMKKMEEEEKKTMLEMLSFLEEQRRELGNRRDKEKQQLNGVETDLRDNSSLCKKVNEEYWFSSGKLESLKEVKCELDKRKMVLKNSLESTEKALKRTSEMISKLKVRKPNFK